MTENESEQNSPAKRREKEKEARANLSPGAAEKLRRLILEEELAGRYYDPFRGLFEHERTEIKVEQVYTGCLGAIVRDLGKGEDSLRIYGEITEETRGKLFPQGIDPVYLNQAILYRRWNQLDSAYERVKAEIAKAKAPRPRTLTAEERIAALEAKLAAIQQA